MRRSLGILLLLCAGFACADRLVFIPKGKRIPKGEVRLEYLNRPDDSAWWWLGYGVTDNIEAEFTVHDPAGGDVNRSGNVAYNLILPVEDTSPGITFGIMDIGDRTPERRAVYAAFTLTFGNIDPQNQNTPTELTFGLWSRKSGAVFVGAMVPVTDRFHLLAEYDSRRLSAGAELWLLPEARARILFIDGQLSYGLTLQKRF